MQIKRNIDIKQFLNETTFKSKCDTKQNKIKTKP